MWRRRRQRRVQPAEVVLADQDGRPDSVGHRADLATVDRSERALAVLAVQACQLDYRLERLERRLGQQEEARLDLPTHTDVLDVRLHSARVAAEVARLAVELRGLGDLVDRGSTPEVSTPRQQRLAALAEQIIELSDAFETSPADTIDAGPAGWRRPA